MTRNKWVFFIFLAWVVLFAMPNHSAAATKYLKVKQDHVPVYDNRSGSLVQAGTLIKGQSFAITKDYGENWWQIRFGNYYGYVNKRAVDATTSANFTNGNTKFKSTNTVVTAILDTIVYDNSKGHLQPFAIIEEKTSFAILFKSGNWYAVDVGGRIGYIYHSAVKTTGNASPLPSGKSNKAYIKALADAPIYDSRRGYMDEFARLKKGQELEVTQDFNTTLWQVKWGNTFAYIKKDSVQKVNKGSFKNANSSYKTTNQHIVPIKDNVAVMDDVSSSGIPFATLEANHRYPIIEKKGNWYLLDIGGRYGYVHHTLATLSNGIPVLMYHHILDEADLGIYKGVNTTISTEQFEREMTYLAEQQFETITSDELLQYIQGKITLPAKAVLITFDDGLLSTRDNAYPIMAKLGLKATQYLITSRNNDKTQIFDPTSSLRFFSQEDKLAMSNVWEYQSHTFNMHNIADGKGDLITKPFQEVKADLLRSKQDLPNATSFAYPFGQYTSSTIAILKELKFTNAMTTNPGYANIGDDPYQIKRFGIYQHTSFAEFQKIVNGKK